MRRYAQKPEATHPGKAAGSLHADLQPKLKINTPGDSYEQEADSVADQVMRMTDSSPKHACSCGGGCPGCQSRNAHPDIQLSRTRKEGDSRAIAPPIAHQVLNSQGQSLEPGIRTHFEQRFGQDFSNVQIHTGSDAAASAETMHARAYTAANHIVFADGYTPSCAGENGRLLAHELTHVVQQSAASQQNRPTMIQRDGEEGDDAVSETEGEEVSDPEEQRRRFIEAFEENPAAAMESIGNILEIGAGRFEVYGLIYHNTRTGELQIVRRMTRDHQTISAQVQLLLERGVTNPQTQLRALRNQLTDLSEMGGVQQAIENAFHNPTTALATLDRVASDLSAGNEGYPNVSDDQLQQVAGVIEAFFTSHAFTIPREERPRPEGMVLLGYFHTHPQTTPPSGLSGLEQPGGDLQVGLQLDEGSFMITGTPSEPRVFFIANGRYWDLTSGMQSAIERQSSTIVGYDESLGGAFLEQMFGAHGFVARMRASDRPGASLSYGGMIGDYRLRVEGEINPAVTSEERMHEGDTETSRLIQESIAGGTLEFDFTSQPYVPGTISLEYLSEGLFRARARINPWPTVMNLSLGGGVSVFEGSAGVETEGYIEVDFRGIPVPGLGGELGGGMRYNMPQDDFIIDAFYQNPWLRVDYTATLSEGGDEVTHGVVGTIDYTLPTGSLQLQLGYQDQVFGSIGYTLHF